MEETLTRRVVFHAVELREARQNRSGAGQRRRPAADPVPRAVAEHCAILRWSGVFGNHRRRVRCLQEVVEAHELVLVGDVERLEHLDELAVGARLGVVCQSGVRPLVVRHSGGEEHSEQEDSQCFVHLHGPMLPLLRFISSAP